MANTLIRKIAAFGERYRNEFLSQCDPAPLMTDWWQALDFLLARICFQGRRDTESFKVYRAAIEVLGVHFRGAERDENLDAIKAAGWNPLQEQLAARIGEGMCGKARDREMVISALGYIDRLPGKNIVVYSSAEIRAGRLKRHFEGLQPYYSKDGIRQVGEKVASFYLRDLVSL